MVLSIKAIIMQLYLGSARKQHRSTLRESKQKHEVLRFSSRRETPRSHVLDFRATSGHNVLCMRNDVSKEISRFRLPSSGRRRLLLKVPNIFVRSTRAADHKIDMLRVVTQEQKTNGGYKHYPQPTHGLIKTFCLLEVSYATICIFRSERL